MKARIFTLFTLISFASYAQQWQGTNPIYFNAGNVGIGTSTPGVWFGSKTFEFSDYRPVFKLTSWSAGLSTIVFTNSSVNSSTHVGEFHLNYQFDQTNNDKSLLIFGSYPANEVLNLQSNGNVAIKDNKLFGLRGIANTDTGIQFDASSETVRISHTKDNYDRYVSFGGYSSGTWYPQMTLNTKSGNVGIGTTSPKSILNVADNGVSTNASGQFTGGLIIQGNTGGRSQTNGAQLEFVIPANTDGSNLWGQGRIITVAGNSNSEHASGRMILGTRRMFQKPGTSGNAWYYGDDLTIDQSGNVGIGTTNPQQKLHVKGTVYSTEVKVDLAAGTGPDYVFEKDYKLTSLEEVKSYIDENKHLPEVPSAKEMEKNGIQLGEMNMLLLKKIEELTLYVIELKKENAEEKEEMKKIKLEVNKLKK